jgi:hypothetical protein
MQVCPAVCTTTYEIVLNVSSLAALISVLVWVLLFYLKKIRLWQLVLLLSLSLLFVVLVGVKINTCDSGCAKNGSIKFENELFGDKD